MHFYFQPNSCEQSKREADDDRGGDMQGMNAFSPDSLYSSTLNIIPGQGNFRSGTLMLQHD